MTAPRSGFSARSSPAFAVGSVGWEPDPAAPQTGWNYVPVGGWICFHCGDRFTDPRGAENHFGDKIDVPPICVLVADFIGEIREKHVRHIVRRMIFRAISDPGETQGMKGDDRSLTDWQTDAVMALLDGPGEEE